MKLISALYQHICLVLLLKHNGSGMPKQLPAAFTLAITYCLISMLNIGVANIQFEALCGMLFIVQFYLFILRNPLISLLLFISVIVNSIHLLVTYFGAPEIATAFLAAFEYVMVFFAITNTLKSELQTHP